MSGRISGVFKSDSFSSTFSGGLNGDGSFTAPARGVLQGNFLGKVSPYPFNGTVSGRVDGSSGSGRWSGKNRYGGGGGAWQARR